MAGFVEAMASQSMTLAELLRQPRGKRYDRRLWDYHDAVLKTQDVLWCAPSFLLVYPSTLAL